MSSNNQILSNNNLNVNTSSKYFNRDIKEYREEKRNLLKSMELNTPKIEEIQVKEVPTEEHKRPVEKRLSKEEQIKNDDFLSLIEEQEKQETKNVAEKQKKLDKKLSNIHYKKLYNLVPKIHLATVENLVEKTFLGNYEIYINTIPMFFDPMIWNESKKKSADSDIINNLTNRQAKAQKKALILHSAQLLNLVGYHRQKILTLPMTKMYVDELKESDEYIDNLRLINSKGKIFKLESNHEKQTRQLARRNKIADTMELLAQDKGFTNSMITITLPPAYHSAPKIGKNSFDGSTPQKAVKLLQTFWKSFRASLSNAGFIFGDNDKDRTKQSVLGLSVIELQGDSTLHLHACIYHDKKDEQKITDCLHDVEDNYNSKQTEKRYKLGGIDSKGNPIRGFNIQYSNQGKKEGENFRSGANYLMKYLYKTHAVYDEVDLKDEGLKNQAGRWFYGVRSFNFFGFNGAITKFEFLIKNYLSYQMALPREIFLCLKANDMYCFIKNYHRFFENEYQKENGKKVFKGVMFNYGLYKKEVSKEKQNQLVLDLLDRLDNEILTIQAKIKRITEDKKIQDESKQEKIITLNNVINRKLNKIEKLKSSDVAINATVQKIIDKHSFIFVEKKVFSIFQVAEENKDIIDIKAINLESLENSNVKTSFEVAQLKQDDLDKFVDDLIEQYNIKYQSNVLRLKDIEEIRNYIDNSIVVQLFKAVQVVGVSPDKKEERRRKALDELNFDDDYYQNWLEEKEIFNH
ncbi:replication endonuclease [Enterobacter roggenkampii]|uniref:replication endonuclease n=1 Tax=Enterobacter roggenkampii TaxID=1812935 RepID=UPI0024475BBF|nr:replication endonuclease [Enterobacter roggenkampii]MDG9878082.1 replication endonuclease [Enterobacter roggenkampii]